jgi:CheY-like chemotaxis protein
MRLIKEENNVCEIKIEVADTGVGISEKQQARIFTPFGQAESGTTRKYGGTGLGLAISKRIVEMMGGEIWVTSTPGGGSVFSFTIQAEKSNNENNSNFINSAQDVNTETDCFDNFNILLAEDVEMNREIVLALLEPTLIKIDCAGNGLEALRMFTENPQRYNIIFMDLQMPEMDGYEATRRIRALNSQKAAEVPIVALSANVFRDDIEKCMEAGMNSHLGKPLNFDEVRKILQKYLIK